MTRLQIALASLDAFVIVAGASVVGNLLAGRILRWWAARDVRRWWDEGPAAEQTMPAPFGIVREPMPGGRCAHLRNADQWAKDYIGETNETKKGG